MQWFVIISSLHLQIPDDVCIILITYIILFSTDFCLLSDRSMVERTQASWWEVLVFLLVWQELFTLSFIFAFFSLCHSNPGSLAKQQYHFPLSVESKWSIKTQASSNERAQGLFLTFDLSHPMLERSLRLNINRVTAGALALKIQLYC